MAVLSAAFLFAAAACSGPSTVACQQQEGGLRTCTESTGRVDDALRSSCADGTLMAGTCAHASATAGCRLESSGLASTVWYEGYDEQAVRDACAHSGAAFVEP